MDEIITLDYGSGGLRTAGLIDSMLVPALRNEALEALGDGAVVPFSGDQLVFSTDSFVVTPWKFPGATSASWRYAAPSTTSAWPAAIPSI